ncbi:MAG: H-NS histone family protein [Methylibium sp.]|nr:H-NS histone family protein [Methylibium sp.]MBA3589025.1 H-NS histone family protein [Methylibium sp.]
MATYQELISQKAALEKQAAELHDQIETARQGEHTEAVAQIKALMEKHGVTMAELGGTKGKPGRTPRAAKAANGPGRKVAPKYRNPATGDTWSGRGLQPNWLKAALASGKKIDEFAL